MNQPLLSICIPTYNRYTKLKPMLEQLLLCPRNDFEVVIQDNCSTDDTKNLKNDFKDERIKLLKNPVNIGGIINGYEALYTASGKYCMICLDKDTVKGDCLSDFLDYLSENSSINYGICELNKEIENSVYCKNNNQIYTDYEKSFSFFAYRSRHPSGMFWKTELLRKTDIVPKILSSHVVFGFFTELIYAEIASQNANGCFYKNSLIVTETSEESARKKTLTYDISQIFFLPKNRIREFKVYLGQLSKLKVKNKIKIWCKVFYRGLKTTTFGFKVIMQDKEHLYHYGLEPKKIEIMKLIKISFNYCFSILFTSSKKTFDSLFI